MTRLSVFTSSVRAAEHVDPTIKTWLYGTRDLERKLCERIIFLSRYCDRIPEPLLPGYTDLLLEVLADKEVKEFVLMSEALNESISKFAELLEQSTDPERKEKASQIREAAIVP